MFEWKAKKKVIRVESENTMKLYKLLSCQAGTLLQLKQTVR